MVSALSEKINIGNPSQREYKLDVKWIRSETSGLQRINISEVLKRLFLPIGFPDSVRPEYLSYQMWDSIQGISSYLRSVLTTRSILIGYGVGSIESSPVAAACVWALNDGIGMVGSLSFAYIFSDVFEVNIKEWRLFADLLNNVGLTFDMMISLLPKYYIFFTACSALTKSCCGLVAGATKAKISAHFAVKDRLADVIAKESTQETAVGLIGMVLGAICAKLIGSDLISNWVVFIVLLFVHQWANYNLVKVLILDSINPQRSMILTQELIFIRKQENSLQYLQRTNKYKPSLNDPLFDKALNPNIYEHIDILSPSAIAKKESLYRPIYLSAYGPQCGCSFDLILNALNHCTEDDNCNISKSERTYEDKAIWNDLQQCWKQENFIIGFDINGRVCACLQEGSSENDEVKAYFISCYLQCIWTQNSSSLDLENRKFSFTYYLSQMPTLFMSIFSQKIDKKKQLLLRYDKLVHNDAKESLNWFNNLLEVDHTGCSKSVTTTKIRTDSSLDDTISILSNDKSTISINTMEVETKAPSQNLFEVLSKCGWAGVTDGKARLGSGGWRYQCEETKKDK